MSSWACSTCTYLNPPDQKTRCEICQSAQPQSHPSPSSSPSKPQWSCSSCTFLNPYRSASCEICGTRESASLISTLEVGDDELELGSSVGSVFLPLRNFSSNSGGAGFYGGLKGSVPPLRRGDCGGGLVNGGKKDVGDGSGEGRVLGVSGEGFSLKRCSKRKEMEEEDAGIEVGRVGDVIGVSSGFRAPKAADKAVEVYSSATGETHKSSGPKTWKILSYNIWFREDLEMRERMRALGYLIELHSPDVICFQEVTPSFFRIFQQSKWWNNYQCSIPDEMSFPGGYFCMQLCRLPVKSFTSQPFHNSIMGRELCVSNVEFQPGTIVTVATSHLESPCPGPPTWDQMFSKERVAQAKEAVTSLNKYRNAIFCGDMNWDDKLDGPFPLPDGWADVWAQLRPGENGWTYDTKSNKMLSGNRALQKRLDRFVCKLNDFKVSKIEMIGTDEIPGLSYVKEKKVKGQVVELVLPVLPSDHYGLLLTISPQ